MIASVKVPWPFIGWAFPTNPGSSGLPIRASERLDSVSKNTMYLNVEHAEIFSQALIQVESASATEWLFELLDHGALSFKNKIVAMEDQESISYWGRILADINPLKMSYIRELFRQKLAEQLSEGWDLNEPEKACANHILRHTKLRVNPLLADVCNQHQLDPTILSRFLPSQFVLTIKMVQHMTNHARQHLVIQ